MELKDDHQHRHQHGAQGGGRRAPLRRIEVMTGTERRRRWSEDEKATITAESLEPGVRVAAVARRHGVSLGLLHSWRRSARKSVATEPLRFVPVVAKAAAEECAGGTIDVMVGDARIRVIGPVDVPRLRRVLAAVRADG